MDPAGLEAYGRVCGWTLARAHARSGDRIAIAAYLGSGDASTAPWRRSPRRTPTRTKRDYRALEEAVASGRVAAEMGV